jgi:hypothetical protein
VVSDAKAGRPLAIMESITLTGIRTAATAALAAHYGAGKNSKRLTVIGCGAQAKYQLEALRPVFPVETVHVFDINSARAEAFAAAHSTPDCTVTPALSLRVAIADVDICITCTTSKSPVLTEDLRLKGCFVAAVGADYPEKHEIAPGLMRRARILTIWKLARRAEISTTPCARERSPRTACMPGSRRLPLQGRHDPDLGRLLRSGNRALPRGTDRVRHTPRNAEFYRCSMR